jgi:hypothetical protein
VFNKILDDRQCPKTQYPRVLKIKLRISQEILVNGTHVRSTGNNFVDWPHSGAVMHYREYVEPRDGAVSVLLSSQQEAVACVRACVRACGVFRKKVTVVKASCLRVAKIENVAL